MYWWLPIVLQDIPKPIPLNSRQLRPRLKLHMITISYIMAFRPGSTVIRAPTLKVPVLSICVILQGSRQATLRRTTLWVTG